MSKVTEWSPQNFPKHNETKADDHDRRNSVGDPVITFRRNSKYIEIAKEDVKDYKLNQNL